MKKVFSLMAAFALMLTLSACGEEECKPEVVEEEVIKYVDKVVEKEVIKEVPVEVKVPAVVEMERYYKPGTYFKASEADENGVITFASVVVDEYGRIIGVHVDNTSTKNKYKYDEEENKLYVYVKGVEDVIPNAYRYVDVTKSNWKLPTINDSIMSEDLVEGYPWHDKKIETLVSVNANETQQVLDFFSKEDNTWSDQMKLVVKKIINDQTTYGINLYESGDKLLTNTIKDVDIDISKELELVQDILDKDAKLEDKATLATKVDSTKGLFKSNSIEFEVSKPTVTKNGVSYNTSLVVTDEFGKLVSVTLDETYSKDNVSTTKKLLGEAYGMKESSEVGKEWFEQINLLEEAIVNSQGYEALKYVSHNEDRKEVKFENLYKTLDKTNILKYPAEVENVAGVTVQINGIVRPLFSALDDVKNVVMEDGVYSSKLGNDLMTIVVDGGKIIAVNLDTLEKRDQAYITIEGTDYPLYTYEKGSLDLSLEEQKTLTLIYKDGEEYKHATNEGVDHKKAYEVGDVVKFDYEGYEEESTIKEVSALTTKKALQGKYGMAKDGKLEWFEQARVYEEYIVENGYNKMNMTGETTDSVSGLTIKVKGYNDLLQKLIISANDTDNQSKAYVHTTLAKLGLGDYKLAKGSYSFTSDEPTKDGGLYLLNLIVLDNGEAYISVDETIEVDGKLTTKNTLGKEYRVEYKNDELVKVDDKDAPTYAEFMSNKLSDALEANEIVSTKALHGYDYELDSTIDYDKDEDKLINNDLLASYTKALEKALISGLQARVREVGNELVKYFEDEIIEKEQYIVASDKEDSGKLSLNVNDEKIILATIGGKAIEYKLDIESLTDDVDVDDTDNISSTTWNFTASSDDILVSTKAKFKLTLEFDDYEVIEKEFLVPVLSNNDYKLKMLNDATAEGKDINENLSATNDHLLSGTELTLKLDTTLNADKLGNEASANKDLMFKVTETDEVIAYSETVKLSGTNALNMKLAYNAGKLVSANGGDVTLKAGTYTADKYTLTVSSNVTIADNTDLLAVASYGGNVKYRLTSETSATPVVITDKVLKDIFLLQNGDVLENNTKVKVFTDKAVEDDNKGLVEGTFSVKGFFDAYDQTKVDDGKGTWQKGEPSRDFTFTVLSEKQALKTVKGLLGDDIARYGVQSKVNIPLLTKDDIEIDGVDIKWFKNDDPITENKITLDPSIASQKINLQAVITTGKEVKAEDADTVDAKYNEEYIKSYDLMVNQISEYAVKEKLTKGLDSIIFDKYVDINVLASDNTNLTSKTIDSNYTIPTIDLTYTWKDYRGKEVAGGSSLYAIANNQARDMKEGEVKEINLTLELSYEYKEQEFKLNKDYSFNVFANSDRSYEDKVQYVVTEPSTSSVTPLRFFIPTVKADTNSIETQIKAAIAAGYKNIVIPKMDASKLNNITITGNTTSAIVFEKIENLTNQVIKIDAPKVTLANTNLTETTAKITVKSTEPISIPGSTPGKAFIADSPKIDMTGIKLEVEVNDGVITEKAPEIVFTEAVITASKAAGADDSVKIEVKVEANVKASDIVVNKKPTDDKKPIAPEKVEIKVEVKDPVIVDKEEPEVEENVKNETLESLDSLMGQDYPTLMGRITDHNSQMITVGSYIDGKLVDNKDIKWTLQQADGIVVKKLASEVNDLSKNSPVKIKDISFAKNNFEFNLDASKQKDFVFGSGNNDNLTIYPSNDIENLNDVSSFKRALPFRNYVIAEAIKNSTTLSAGSLLESGCTIAVDTVSGNDNGKLVIRATLGDSYRDFSFDVVSEARATAIAQEMIKDGFGTPTVNNGTTIIDLVDVKDIKIDGLTIDWQLNSKTDAKGSYNNFKMPLNDTNKYLASENRDYFSAIDPVGIYNGPFYKARFEMIDSIKDKVNGINATGSEIIDMAVANPDIRNSYFRIKNEPNTVRNYEYVKNVPDKTFIELDVKSHFEDGMITVNDSQNILYHTVDGYRTNVYQAMVSDDNLYNMLKDYDVFTNYVIDSQYDEKGNPRPYCSHFVTNHKNFYVPSVLKNAVLSIEFAGQRFDDASRSLISPNIDLSGGQTLPSFSSQLVLQATAGVMKANQYNNGFAVTHTSLLKETEDDAKLYIPTGTNTTNIPLVAGINYNKYDKTDDFSIHKVVAEKFSKDNTSGMVSTTLDENKTIIIK